MGDDLVATRSGTLLIKPPKQDRTFRRRHNRVDKPRQVHPRRSKAIHESRRCSDDTYPVSQNEGKGSWRIPIPVHRTVRWRRSTVALSIYEVSRWVSVISSTTS